MKMEIRAIQETKKTNVNRRTGFAHAQGPFFFSLEISASVRQDRVNDQSHLQQPRRSQGVQKQLLPL